MTIYAVTPNPALDLGGVATRIIPNEKTYIFRETRNPGGNGINAARILAKLGYPVITTGFLGGSIGEEVESLLHAEGLDHRFIRIQGHTRINLTVSNETTHLQTRLSFPGPLIRRRELAALTRQMEKMRRRSLLMIGGSLPRGLTPTYIARLIAIARRRGIPAIVDIPSRELKAVIKARPFLIKPNLLEFQTLISHKVRSMRAIVDAAKRLTADVPFIAVSSVERGALLVSKTRAWFAHGPNVAIRSSVGAGDAMVGAMAGVIHAHVRATGKAIPIEALVDRITADGPAVLRSGLAAALATLSKYGTRLGSRHAIQGLCKKVQVEEV